MTADDGDYSLVMPFVVCGEDGFDDDSFVNGWLCGVIDTKLRAVAGTPCTLDFMANPRVVPQLDLIAMKHGLALTTEPWDEHPDEWARCVIAVPSPSDEVQG